MPTRPDQATWGCLNRSGVKSSRKNYFTQQVFCFFFAYLYFYVEKKPKYSYMNTHFLKKGLWVRDRSRIRLIPFHEITHIHHSDGISEVRMGRELLKKLHIPLRGLEQMMPPQVFVRTHRNYIINTSFIDRYLCGRKLSVQLGGESIPVSRRRKKQLEKILMQQHS